MLLLLTAFPRKDGFTRYCTDLFIRGVKESGVPYSEIDITTTGIQPCLGCFHCWCSTPGKCIQTDGMDKLLDAFLECDALVCATPLYAYGIGSFLKMFFERTLPLLAPGITTSVSGIDRNNIRFPDRGPRHMAGIITGGLRGPVHAEGACTSLRLYAEGFDMTFCGAIVRSESYLLQFTDTKPKTIKSIETAFEQAGRSFALNRTIDGETIRRAEAPLAPTPTVFQNYSNIYWEHAGRVFERGGTIDEIRYLTRSDIRILMQEMAHNVDPITTAKLRAVLRFVFTDSHPSYTITIDRGTALLETGEKQHYDLTVTCTTETWVDILHRTANPVKALASGAIKLTGDKDLFRKLGRFFPPPSN
jgi:multimeric flavodoxin WrbA/putative sterol carrier protein